MLISCPTKIIKVDFFFQAEDGIRDGHVTGVQTCALPISDRGSARHRDRSSRRPRDRRSAPARCARSEERRVGKECRSRWTKDEKKEREEAVEKSGGGKGSMGEEPEKNAKGGRREG